jgi:hypothetical protein
MLTITEALAELKTLGSRIEKQRGNIMRYLGRDAALRDPLERDGGSVEYIKRQLQSVRDLEERIIKIRTAIQTANNQNNLALGNETRTVGEWLAWRREIAPRQEAFVTNVISVISQARTRAVREGARVVEGRPTEGSGDREYVFNVSETDVAEEAERLTELLGTLDGKLSLFNATVSLDI